MRNHFIAYQLDNERLRPDILQLPAKSRVQGFECGIDHYYQGDKTMDFQSLKTNVTAVKTEAETIVEAVTNPQNKTALSNFITQITKLSDFLDDAQNVKALNDYDKKPDNKDNYPLDNLCKDILAKLVEVEPLLVSTVFDYMRPNQPTTNEHGQRIMPPVQYNTTAFFNLQNALNALFASSLLSAFEVLKYLSGHNKTLIIWEPTGAVRLPLQIT